VKKERRISINLLPLEVCLVFVALGFGIGLAQSGTWIGATIGAVYGLVIDFISTILGFIPVLGPLILVNNMIPVLSDALRVDRYMGQWVFIINAAGTILSIAINAIITAGIIVIILIKVLER